MRRLIHYIKHQLSLSFSEAKEFLSLLIVCLVLLALLFFPRHIIQSNNDVDPDEMKMLDSLASLMESINYPTYFSFNPNIISVDSLLLLGFSENVAQRLDNYRSKGGRFEVKTDIKKIYGLRDELFENIKPYISLPDSTVLRSDLKRIYDINKATNTDLANIEGIENYLAERIIRYRDLLGGFVQKEQLREVYGLEEVSLANISTHVYVSEGYQPKKISINHASKEEIMKHPYISVDLATDIIRFREINGVIESEKLLANFKSIDKSNFQKLISYLDFH